MADIPVVGEYFKVTGADVNRYILGGGGDTTTQTMSLVLVATTPVGVVGTLQCRSSSNWATQNNAEWFAASYRKLWLNNAAGDGSLVATALSDDSVIIIPCSGLQIALNLTGHTSGTLEFYIKRMTGAPAI